MRTIVGFAALAAALFLAAPAGHTSETVGMRRSAAGTRVFRRSRFGVSLYPPVPGDASK